MAGENTIDVSQYPDQFFEVTAHFAKVEDMVDNQYLYYCERDIVVDAVNVVYNTDNDGDFTIELKKNIGGTSVFTAALQAFTKDTVHTASFNTSEHYCPAGTMLNLVYTGDSAAQGLVVQMRARTRLK